jgi:4'-phosphopantetheinyl transferase
MLALSPERVDLWFAFTDKSREPVSLAAYFGLLNAEERAQQARFHFARDRHRYLLTRALVRTTLSKYASVAPADWRFSTNAHGRPQVLDEHQLEQPLCFNVSHTEGLIVLAVSAGQQIGVDTEDAYAREAPIDIAQRFFAPSEVAALMALPAHSRPERFFHYWTLKESYIKARGMGLALPLDRFHFDFIGGDTLRLHVDPELHDAARWRFWLMQLAQDYAVALCLERISDAPVEIRMACPLHDHVQLDQRLLRTSE